MQCAPNLLDEARDKRTHGSQATSREHAENSNKERRWGEEEINNPFEARLLPAINVLLTMRKRTSSLYNELLQPVRTFKLSINRTYQCVNAQYAHATGLFFASFA